jgi:hypothetical protein
MSITDTEVAEATMVAAAEMARTLGMTLEEDMTTIREGQQVMMVTATGIVVGKIRVANVEAPSARMDWYLLDDTVLSESKMSEKVLCKYRFGANGNGGFFEEPDIVCSLPEGAVLYTL